MAGIDDLMVHLNGLQVRMMRTSPIVARAMGNAFQDRVRNVTLRRYQHPMFVRTQAPAGGPPAFMSGELAYSITMHVAGGVSTSRAYVGPHTIYAGVQEFGAEIDVRNAKYMRWFMDGQFWYKKHVSIPERPYMRTTRDEMIADGSLHRVAVEAFLAGEGF